MIIESVRSKKHLVSWFLILILTSAFVFINWPFLIPLVMAGIFALGLNDLVFKISTKRRISHKIVVSLTVLTGLALFWIPLALATYRVVSYIEKKEATEVDHTLNQISGLKELTLRGVQTISDWIGVDIAGPARGILENVLKKTGEIIFNYSSQFLTQLPTIVLGSFVFVITLFVLLLKANDIKKLVLKYSPIEPRSTEPLIDIFKKSCSVTLVSTLVVGLIQAVLIGIGSLIFREGDFWLVLTITFFLSFIPVIGAAPMGYLLAILAFLDDRMGATAGLVVVATVAGSIDNILKPMIMSGAIRVSPVVGFTCVVGAVIMLGLPGLLLGPVIMNLFVGIVPLLLDKK